MSEVPPKLYLLDVEGTVAPLSLTSEVLFPYARAHFEEFLRQVQSGKTSDKPGHSPEEILLDMVRLSIENKAETDPEAPRILPPESFPGVVSLNIAATIPKVLEYVYWLMDRDRKSTALKSLQGKIWKAGFESGELIGTVFDDVPGAFRRWSDEARVAIYSSGSVEAQKLFFRYSSDGDLTAAISGYFDTRTGPKVESASYAAIAKAMEVAPQELLFFSDSVRELDAAREAGCRTRLVMRPGNLPVDDRHGHAIIRSISEAD